MEAKRPYTSAEDQNTWNQLATMIDRLKKKNSGLMTDYPRKTYRSTKKRNKKERNGVIKLDRWTDRTL